MFQGFLFFCFQEIYASSRQCTSLNKQGELLYLNEETVCLKKFQNSHPNFTSMNTNSFNTLKYFIEHDKTRFASYGSDTSKKKSDIQIVYSSKKFAIINIRTLLEIPAMIDEKWNYFSPIKEGINVYPRPLSFISNSLSRSHQFEYEKCLSKSIREKNNLLKCSCEFKYSRYDEISNYATKDFRDKEESIQISGQKYAESQIWKNDNECNSIHKSDITKSVAKDSYEDFTKSDHVSRRSTTILEMDLKDKNWIDKNAKKIINIEDKQYNFSKGKIIHVFIYKINY